MPVTPFRSTVAGLSRSRTLVVDPTSTTVLPTWKPDGVVPPDVPAVGGFTLPSQPAGARTVVASGTVTVTCVVVTVPETGGAKVMGIVGVLE